MLTEGGHCPTGGDGHGHRPCGAGDCSGARADGRRCDERGIERGRGHLDGKHRCHRLFGQGLYDRERIGDMGFLLDRHDIVR